MKRTSFVLLVPILLAGAAVVLLRDSAPAKEERTNEPDRDTDIEERPEAREVFHSDPIEGAPCRLRGVIERGIAARVAIHSERAEIDLEADLAADGKTFTAELPEQGPVLIVAVDREGRTAEKKLACGVEGELRAVLAFPDKRGDARVKGRCTYLETGASAAGAIVRATKPRAKEVLWTAIADERGAFSARVTAAMYSLVCAKDMDESEPRSVLLEPNAEKVVELAIDARSSVAGIVSDERGELVEGARVIGRSARVGVDEVAREEASDSAGRFRIRGLVPGAVVIQAESDGRYAEAQVVARAGLPYAEVKLVLRGDGLRIFGTISSPDGVPIEGANVRVDSIGYGRVPLSRSAISGQAGEYAIGGLMPGAYVVHASAQDWAEGSKEVEELAAPVEVSLELQRACSARIRVLPATPARAVSVRVHRRGDREERWRSPLARLSGQTGQPIALEGVEGEVALYVQSEGSVSRTATLAVDLCAANGTIDVDLSSNEDFGSLEVEVVNRDGLPLAGVEIGLDAPGRDGVSDQSGRVLFEGLPPREYEVRADESMPETAMVRAGQVARARLRLDRGDGDVSGVVTSLGRPVEGAAIRAECGDTGRPRSLRDAPVLARSDASGSFSFEPKDGGVCTVRAEHATYGSSEPATLRAGALPAIIELASFGTIEGRVVELATKKPIAPYTVTIRPVGRAADVDARSLYVSDASGRFRADGLTPGTQSISVVSERGRAHAEIELPPGKAVRGVELAVFDEGTIVGRVVGPEGPVANARLFVRRVISGARFGEAGDPVANTRSAEDGRFELRVASGDAVRVLASAPGFYPWGSEPLSLDGARATDLGDIVLEARTTPEEKEGGIGIMFAPDPHGVRVVQFMPDSPARDAGLENGDVITAIDGTPAGRLPMVSWLVALRGPPGTPVLLEIERGTNPRFNVTVIRRAIGLGAMPDEP